MSKRIDLPATPLSYPDLFVQIDPDDVQPGDIFQGTGNTSKWYENEDKGDVEDWRKYFRRKPADLDSAAAPAGGHDGMVNVTMTWTVSKAGIKHLVEVVQDITNDD